MERKPEIIVIGAGIVDVLVSGANKSVFERSSTPAGNIAMQTGGDALNESVILGRLGRSVRLVSRLGEDAAGKTVLNACREAGVDTSSVVVKDGLSTGVNIVLIDEAGERRFITNPLSSLRKIEPEDVMNAIARPDFARAKIASFASIFVYPLLTPVLEKIFAAIKAKGLILCADMTKRKNGETVRDIAGALQYVDYIFPNYEEAALVTGCEDVDAIADSFLACGVKNVVMKLGGQGCLVKNANLRAVVPAVPGIHAVDTTGAGDNFAAGFINALYEGLDILSCAKFANATASICVEQVGATSGKREREEIERRMKMIQA